ncbi:MAG: (d)CMP kinase [Thermoguttaceae bacterium]|nr:(d)CMP kinase [Thermoguttaceae bacterium]
MNNTHVITIDGPAGSGKSTVARLLARRLGVDFLDTGAMYRAAALLGLRRKADWNDPQALVRLVQGHQIVNRFGKTTLDGEDVSQAIRTGEVTGLTHFAADNPGIREIMVALQRQCAVGRSLVTEGRDQGSVVFPDAYRKFYLTASAEERARRRAEELRARGENPDIEQLRQQILLRDQRDSQREVGPLRVPDGAMVIDSTEMSVDEVVEKMYRLTQSRQ